MSKLLIVPALAAAFALTACNQNAAEGEAASTSTEAGSAAAPAAETPRAAAGAGQIVSTADLPKLRPGIWRTVNRDADGAEETRQCVTADQDPTEMIKDQSQNCRTFEFRRTLTGGFALNAQCANEGIQSSLKYELNGDFNSRLGGQMTIALQMPGQEPVSYTSNYEMTYVGPCAPGQEDSILSE